MLLTLSMIRGLDGETFNYDGYTVLFYQYMDRIWVEVNEDETNETLFEGQITDAHELKNLCWEVNRICEINAMEFLGIITTRLLFNEIKK